LKDAGVAREAMFDVPGLMCTRRDLGGDGTYYFIANRGEKSVNDWLPIAHEARSVVILDPLTGAAGVAASQSPTNGQTEVRVQLEPGQSLILHAFADHKASGAAWSYWAVGTPIALPPEWKVKFVSGGPELPEPFSTERLVSWTELGGT